MFTEEHEMSKFQVVWDILIRARILIVGVCLAVLPWVGSFYFCSDSPNSNPAANSALPDKPTFARETPPHLFPGGNAVRSISDCDSQPWPIIAVDFPAQPAEQPSAVNGPVLADPVQTESMESAYTPPVGVVAENSFEESPADALPPLWMPKEMPPAERMADGNDGFAVQLPNQQVEAQQPNQQRVQPPNQQEIIAPNQQMYSSTEYVAKDESSPELTASETVREYNNSAAESVQVVQDSIVEKDLKAPANDQENTYPSTEHFMAKKAVKKDIGVRSEQLESIAKQADRQTRHGFELAGRGAYYAARSEFISSLRLVAQGLDTDGQTNIHGKSLAAGLTALKEAEDFIPSGSRLEADLDLPAIIANHTTQAMKSADKSTITTLTALKGYFTYAQEQLAQAAGNEAAGSMALRGMGKLHEELAKRQASDVKAAGQKAVVFYQASLKVYPQNFMAANDLGVMLARNGNTEDARKILEYSCSLSNQSTVWSNLAAVYERLGQADKARQAQQKVLIARQTEEMNRQQKMVAENGMVRWVDEGTFSQAKSTSGIPQLSPTRPAVAVNQVPQQAPAAPMSITGIPQSAITQRSTAMQPMQSPRSAFSPFMQNQYQTTKSFPETQQTSSNINNSMPTMRPASQGAATGRLPATPYDWRR
jgi:tetratricopeptide (TPR) repeat protein